MYAIAGVSTYLSATPPSRGIHGPPMAMPLTVVPNATPLVGRFGWVAAVPVHGGCADAGLLGKAGCVRPALQKPFTIGIS